MFFDDRPVHTLTMFDKHCSKGVYLRYRIYHLFWSTKSVLCCQSWFVVVRESTPITYIQFVTRFPYYWPFMRVIHRSSTQGPVMRNMKVFFVVTRKKLLKKQPIYRCFETPRRSNEITVMAFFKHLDLYKNFRIWFWHISEFCYQLHIFSATLFQNINTTEDIKHLISTV